MNTDMIEYYRVRANEYEKIYAKPERQEELLQASQLLQEIFKDKDIYEIACGTGYWTERLAATAHSVHATDINESVIRIAMAKNIPHVTFDVADIFSLQPTNVYESLFAGFIWSHIPLEKLDEFLSVIHRIVKPHGTIVFMDNNYVEGSSTPVYKKDEAGNSYQLRTLENGAKYEVLKNFHSEDFLRLCVNKYASSIVFRKLEYYWIMEYKKR